MVILNSLVLHVLALGPESNVKRKQFIGNKSVSYDGSHKADPLGNLAVKHLAVQLPNTSAKELDRFVPEMFTRRLLLNIRLISGKV